MITVATLRAAGATEAVIMRVLELELEARAAYRERERIRKRKQMAVARARARQEKAQQNQQPVARHAAPQKKTPQTPIRKLHSKKSKKIFFRDARARESAKTDFPIDFKPDRDFARGLGLAEPDIDRQALRFRLHAIANGRQASDWPASWCYWLTSPHAPKPAARPQPTGYRAVDIEAQAQRQLAERAEYEAMDRKRKAERPTMAELKAKYGPNWGISSGAEARP